MRFAFLYPTILYFVSGSNPSNEDTPKLTEIKIKEEPVHSSSSELGKRGRETTPDDSQRSQRTATSLQELYTLGSRVINYLKALPANRLLAEMQEGVVSKVCTDPSVIALAKKVDYIVKDAATWSRLELSVFQLLQQELEQCAIEQREPRTLTEIMPAISQAAIAGTVDGQPTVSKGRVTVWYSRILRANTDAPITPGSSITTGDFIRENVNLATTDSGVQYLEMTPIAWSTFALPTVYHTLKMWENSLQAANPAAAPRQSPQSSSLQVPRIISFPNQPRASPSGGMMPPPQPRLAPPHIPAQTSPSKAAMTASIATASVAAGAAVTQGAAPTGRKVHLSPFMYYDKLPGIAREFVHQIFAQHGTETIKELRTVSGNDPSAKILEEYFAAFYMLGLIDNPAFDYLVGGNGRRCHETGVSQLTQALNNLFSAGQPMLMNSQYNEARTAFWCREIVMKKNATELSEFKATHQIEGKDGITITAAEFAGILMPRLKTLHTSTAPITYPQVKQSLPK